MAYDRDKIEALFRARENPAAPAGVGQMATRGAGQMAGDPMYAGSVEGRRLNDEGFNALSSGWYTGANADGTSNGWDNFFTKMASKQYEETLEQYKKNPNAFREWAKRDDATGVVTWGEMRKEGDDDRELRWGDVLFKGDRVANIYDDFDKPTANTMMMPWVMDGKTQAKIMASPDRDSWLDMELGEIRTSETQRIQTGEKQRQFLDEVSTEQTKMLEGHTDTGLALGSGALTAGMALAAPAAAGSAWSGPGALAVGAGAFLIGAGSAWLNRDQLTELSARAVVTSREAEREFGGFQAFTEKLSGYSGVAMKLISPASNSVQGLTDAAIGEGGDGVEDFYSIDGDGNRKAPGWAVGADMVGTLADSMLQFTNPVGRAFYMSSMGGVVAGNTGTLATTGESFDLRTGEYHDHEGVKENAAAWLNIGIDAVQLGVARGIGQMDRGLMQMGSRTPAAAAEAGAVGTGLMPRVAQQYGQKVAQPFKDRKAALQERLPHWAGGVKEGERALTLGGSRYVVDEATGVAKYRGFALASLAPSEFAPRTAVSLRARIKGPDTSRAGAKANAEREMKLQADDFYRSAVELSSNKTSKMGRALLNGLGEGGEEAAQAVLEPWSKSEGINGAEMAESFFYGVASGMGMTFGATLREPPPSEKLYGRFMAKGLLNGEQMPLEQFESLPVDRQRALAELSTDDIAKTNAAKEALAKSLEIKAADLGTMGTHVVLSATQSEFDKVASSANSNLTSLLKVLPHNNEDTTDDQGNLTGHTSQVWQAEVSPWRAVQEISKNVEALGTHVTTLKRDIERDKVRLESGELDESQTAEVQDRITRHTTMLTDAEVGSEVGAQLEQYLRGMFSDYRKSLDNNDVDAALAGIDQMNAVLEAAFSGEFDIEGNPLPPEQVHAVRMAIEVLYSRDPNIEDGSFALLQPKISKSLAKDAADGVIQIHPSLITAPNADHDGDNLRSRRDLMLDRTGRDKLRRGEQYLVYGQDSITVKVAGPVAEATLVDTVRRAINSTDEAVRNAAEHNVDMLLEILWNRYARVVRDQGKLVEVLEQFHLELTNGKEAARENLLNALATNFATDIQDNVARANNTPEWPWISQQITAKIGAVQRAWANARPEYEYEPGKTTPQVETLQGFWSRQVFMGEASTLGATLQLLRPGTNMVRATQGLHFAAYNAAVEALTTGGSLTPPQLQTIQEFYEARGSGSNRSSLEDVLNRDATTRRVFDDLGKILDELPADLIKGDRHQAMLMLAMTKVQDFDFTADGPVPQDRDITLLQSLLRRSVRMDRAALGDTLERNPQAVNRLNHLEALTKPKNNDQGHSTAAQEAAFEVFADIPLYQLIGESAQFLGLQKSLRMLRMELLDMDRESRSRKVGAWRRKAPYFGRTTRLNPPYAASEVASGTLHPYRMAVDLIEAVANKAGPARQARSTSAMNEFVTGMSDLEKALGLYQQQLSPAERAAFDKLSKSEQRLQMVNSNVGLAQALAETIPNAVALGAFRVTDKGQVHAANWVWEMLGMEPKAALMHYWRNTTLGQYLAEGLQDTDAAAQQIIDQVEQDRQDAMAGKDMPRTWAKLQTQSARVIYLVASQRDPVLLSQFLRDLNTATDLETFRDDVLNAPIYRGNMAEVHPLAEDVSEVDTTYERSWQSSYPGAQQREAIKKFAAAASRYAEGLAHAHAVRDSDTQVAGKIKSFLDVLAGKATAMEDGSQFYATQLALAVQNASEIWTSIGPTATDNALAVTQTGIIISHNKGEADPAFVPFGSSRVTLDGGGSSVSIMRSLADVTAHTERDVLENPSLLAHRSMRIQLDNGAIIDWVAPQETATSHELDRPRPDLEQYARLLMDPATAGFIKEVLSLSVKEPTQDGGQQTMVYRGHDRTKQYSLLDILDRTDLQHVFPRADASLTTEQAHEYIALVQGAVFKQVYGSDAQTQARGYFPLQMMMQEAVTAYAHPMNFKLEEGNAREMRDYTARTVARVVQVLGDMHTRSPQLAQAVVREVKENLRKRFGTVVPNLMDSAKTYEGRLQILLESARVRNDTIVRQQQELDAELAAATTDDERVEISERMARHAERARKYTENLEQSLTDINVDSVLAMFTISDDAETAAVQKKHILEYLAAGRLGHFTDDEVAVWQHVRTQLASDRWKTTGEADIPDEMWDAISGAAAAVFLTERSRQMGTQVSIKPLAASDGEWSDVARYFDHTWSYLLDYALTTPVLESAKLIQNQAKYTTHMDVTQAVQEIERTLFNKDRLGSWSHPMVKANLAHREALLTSAVNLAVAIPGDMPPAMTTLISATNRSYDIPPEPPSDVQVTSSALLDDMETALMLEGRFVQRKGGAMLTYTKADGTQDQLDLFNDKLLGEVWGDPSDPAQNRVRKSGFVVITHERLLAAVEKALVKSEDLDSTKAWTLDLKMFDPRARPEGPQWAHNIFYSGTGRERDRSVRHNLIAESFFGSDGVYQTNVQKPLDAIKKAIAAFIATEHIDLKQVTDLERSQRSIYRQLVGKAKLLMQTEYDFGMLQSYDFNAVMTLLRVRHVVQGRNEAGELVTWSVDKALRSEQPGATETLSDMRLIPINERIFNSLMGDKTGRSITPNGLEIDQTTVSALTEITDELLAQHGVSKLGQAGGFKGTDFEHRAPVNTVTGPVGRGAQRISLYGPRLVTWRKEQARVLSERNEARNFNTARHAETVSGHVKDSISAEILREVMRKVAPAQYGGPTSEQLALSERVMSQHLSRMEGSTGNTVMLYLHGVAANPADGVLSQASFSEGAGPVVFGDNVFVDLSTFDDGSPYPQVLATAKKAVDKLADRGVGIHFISSGGAQQTLREDLREYLLEADKGYSQLSSSSLVPITEDLEGSQTDRAIARSLIETRAVDRAGLVLEFRSNQFIPANENAAYIVREQTSTGFDYDTEFIIMRSNILSRRPQGFGRPQTSRQRELARERLRALLDTDAGIDHLAKMGGNGKGVKPALRKLRDQLRLESSWPTDVGQEFGFGYFDVLIDSNDIVYIGRQGHKSLSNEKVPGAPHLNEVMKQALTPLGEDGPVQGEPGTGVVVGPSEVDETLSTNIGKVEKVLPSQHGGGERVLLRVKVSEIGAKGLAEMDAMKFGFMAMPEDLSFPTAEVVPGQSVRIASNIDDGRSKEALFGVVKNFRNAFMSFGADFRADMIEYVKGTRPSAENFADEWAEVEALLKAVERADFNVDASDIAAALRADSFYEMYGPMLAMNLAEQLGEDSNLLGWTAREDSSGSVNDRLGSILIAALMTPKVRLEHVIGTTGMADARLEDANEQMLLMPPVFTDALDDYRYPALREMLFDRFNENFPVNANGERDYFLNTNWDFVVRMERAGKSEYFTGELKVTDLKIDDKHPDAQVQSELSSETSGISDFAAAQANVLFSGKLAHRKDFDRIRHLFKEGSTPEFGDGGADLWSLLQNLGDVNMPAQQQSAAHRLYTSTVLRRNGLYQQDIDKTEWDAEAEGSWNRLSAEIADEMFGDPAYAVHMDYLVRMYLGARGRDPQVESEEVGVDKLDSATALATLRIVAENAREGYLPTFMSQTNPMIDFDLLRTLFEVNMARPEAKRWIPRTNNGRRVTWAKPELGAWIDAAIGQMLEAQTEFLSEFRMDLDGAWATYEGAQEYLIDLPPSTSNVVNMKLMHPDTQELVVSLDPQQKNLLGSFIGLEGTNVTLESLISQTQTQGRATADQVSAAAISQRLERLQAWRAGKKIPKQKPQLIKDYVVEGAWYSRRSTSTHQFLDSLTNLRLFMSLFNPALTIASIPESQIRNLVETSVSLLHGTSTGMTGRALSRLGETSAGEALNLKPRYSVEQQKMIQETISVLGNDPRFLSMLWEETTFHNLITPGTNKFARFLEKAAGTAARMQDAQYKMFAGQAARRYVETALTAMEFDPSNVISVEQLLTELNHSGGLWLAENTAKGSTTRHERSANPHMFALNAVSHIRSMRMTLGGKVLHGIHGPLTQSGNPFGQIAGHLLKWPTIFGNYTFGAATFISGTGGIADFVAAHLHGRRSDYVGRMQAAMRGQQYIETEDSTWDMGDVLEGLDLTRSFLRGGVTWSGYMAYLLMGGVGLSGEDEEMRRRRLLATYYGAPLQYDPNTALDFRDHQLVDVSGLPGPLKALGMWMTRTDQEGGQTSMMMPHWIIRQFVSPFVGIERFMNTGDLRQIGWGFEEAASVMPTSVLRTFNEARETARELEVLASEQAEQASLGDPKAMSALNRFFISLAGTYQRGFLESSFVNTIRNGTDSYDRDPWTQVKTDEHGKIMRDDDGNPLRSETLQSFINDDGEVQQGYKGRSFWEAQAHQYAENNFTFSLLASLVSGKGRQSTYLRKNMAVKQQKVELNALSEDQAKGLVLEALDDMGGLPSLTTREAASVARNRFNEEVGRFPYNNEIEELTLSYEDAAGKEILSDHGARVIFESLNAGTVDLSSESLKGIFIPREMRQKIQNDIIKDLINEGMQWGMDEVTAKGRARRIWSGFNDEDSDAIGLREIVWSKEIPSQPTVAYNQLNTTFVIGPGGVPYATGIRRDSWAEALGINPIGTGRIANTDGGMNVDKRLNSTDEVMALNTGRRALERNEAKELEPDDEGADATLNSPFTPFDKNDSSGNSRGQWRRSGGYRGRGGFGGGGGGGAYAPRIYFQRMQPLPDQRAPYGNDVPFINTNNPYVRRASIRRERVWSDRGRLKQWQ